MKKFLLEKLLEVNGLTGIELLTDTLLDKYENVFASIFDNKKLIVVHDTDCDGLCSARIWMEYSELINSEFVMIPLMRTDRNPLSVLGDLKEDEIVVTLDCGSATDWSLIKNKVYIIDHHIPAEHSENIILINPKQDDEETAYCTSGLIFSLFEKYTEMTNDTALQYAAIGSVADMVPLLYTSRNIVKRGLKAMNSDPCDVAKEFSPFMGKYNEKHIGFFIAPAINAPSRMQETEVAVDAIVNGNLASIKKLKNLNNRRKYAIKKSIEKAQLTFKKNCVIAKIDTDAEISGLVATKLLHKYKSQAMVVLCINESASLRSFDNVDVQSFIMSSDNLSGGGHKNAAGCSFKNEAKLINDFIRFSAKLEFSNQETKTDLIISEDELSNVISCIPKLGPFGQKFRTLLLESDFKVSQIGRNSAKEETANEGYVSLKLKSGENIFNAVCYDLNTPIEVGEEYTIRFEVNDVLEIKEIL